MMFAPAGQHSTGGAAPSSPLPLGTGLLPTVAGVAGSGMAFSSGHSLGGYPPVPTPSSAPARPATLGSSALPLGAAPLAPLGTGPLGPGTVPLSAGLHSAGGLHPAALAHRPLTAPVPGRAADRHPSVVLHEHPLSYSDNTQPWMCDCCGKGSHQFPELQRYSCPQGCNFDLCADCFMMQSPKMLAALKSKIEEEEAEDETTVKLREVFGKIDSNQNGSVSKLELIAAMARDQELTDFVLPGIQASTLMTDEEHFDKADSVFEAIAAGKQEVKFVEFAAHFRHKVAQEISAKSSELREIFDLIDADKSGSISKLELIAAVQQNQIVDDFLLPGFDSSGVMSDEGHFDRVNSIFEAIACGRKRIDFTDFERYFSKVSARPRMRKCTIEQSSDRSATRILIIGPGFGRELNPRQGRMLEEAGYQVHWCVNLPNPESPNFPVAPYLGQIKLELNQFKPDIVACASKGGVYIVGLWQMGLWNGPSLLINAHPTCQKLPQDVPVVLAHGGNDEVYTRGRADLEQLIATGTPNLCFLYYVANSGHLLNGQLSRVGDRHNMESLLTHDCLPRLIDAALNKEGPEVHMMRTWRERLSEKRLEAEAMLGYCPEQLRRRWASAHQRGRDGEKLFDVDPNSEEYWQVMDVFRAHPKETPAYYLAPEAVWDAVKVHRVQRVENGLQEDGSARPYYESLRRSLEDQKLDFEPGTQTGWAFHGTADRSAIESIVTNPVAGFQPLASGSRGASLWGSGSYFARDASYVAQGGFCGHPAADGTRQMLMCLLAFGMPCLGDPQHKGVLPFRSKPHRYNCSVDSLSSPEIYIMQHPGAAHPAYLITFS